MKCVITPSPGAPPESSLAPSRSARRARQLREWAIVAISLGLVSSGVVLGDLDRPWIELAGIGISLSMSQYFLRLRGRGVIPPVAAVVVIAASAIGVSEIVGSSGFFASLLIYSGLVTAVLYVPLADVAPTGERDGRTNGADQ